MKAPPPHTCRLIPLPRPCHVTSHQFGMHGICWAITERGEAVVEAENGHVHTFALVGDDAYHTLWFTDAKNQDRDTLPGDTP